MRKLSSIILLGLLAWNQVHGQNQSPHGEGILGDCSSCHVSENWTEMANPLRFDHDTTRFALLGVHEQVACMNCHESLVFEEVQSDCAACHQDVHSGTVGRDCARCHNENSWLVNIIPEIHEENGFPLTGSHSTLQCIACHNYEIDLRFDRLGNDCANCHMEDFNMAQNPNHIQKGYSHDCTECHDPLAFGWDGQMYEHDFFPLVGGHDKVGCTECHGPGGTMTTFRIIALHVTPTITSTLLIPTTWNWGIQGFVRNVMMFAMVGTPLPWTMMNCIFP
jgi:Zn finger protein HypA/HybF involved in hydrogenase expression